MGEPSSARVEHLEKLDLVVHDFMACIQASPQGPLEGAGSENVARMLRILDPASIAKGPVLGPPVLCGMSPPIGIESLLGLLGSLHKTGVLRGRADDATFMISVVRGDIVHGVCTPRPESELLGNILLSRGAIGADALSRFFKERGSSASHLIEALNREELVRTKDLQEAIAHQMQQLFDRLLVARSAEWCFHEGEATLCYANLRVNVNKVLLESARKQDEGQDHVQDHVAGEPPADRKPLELVWPARRNGRRLRRT